MHDWLYLHKRRHTEHTDSRHEADRLPTMICCGLMGCHTKKQVVLTKEYGGLVADTGARSDYGMVELNDHILSLQNLYGQN
ncbi:MAG: hypothetical protein U5L96_14550 [Owenweeksia sp.]|nr:hypothetical protein [Owenweeksia sp.]